MGIGFVVGVWLHVAGSQKWCSLALWTDFLICFQNSSVNFFMYSRATNPRHIIFNSSDPIPGAEVVMSEGKIKFVQIFKDTLAEVVNLDRFGRYVALLLCL